MVTKTSKTVAVQAADVKAVEAAVTANKPSAAERMAQVLALTGKALVKPAADVKWGKSNGLAGGGSVYINRSNADVRSSTKQVADWAKAGLGTIRGPQGQYLRIAF